LELNKSQSASRFGFTLSRRLTALILYGGWNSTKPIRFADHFFIFRRSLKRG
jgi:hypothetical protein